MNRSLVTLATLGASLAALALAEGAGAQSKTGSVRMRQNTGMGGSGSIRGNDKKALSEAASGNMAEIKLGKLAQQRGNSAFVKQFGAMMVRDHGMALGELQSIARRQNSSLPSKLKPQQQAMYDRLARLNGSSFDKAYRSAMLKDHKEDYAKYVKNSKTVSNGDLKGFFVKNAPTVKRHLAALQQGRMPANDTGEDMSMGGGGRTGTTGGQGSTSGTTGGQGSTSGSTGG